jgi:BirA family transcriptional regulator, biotin operon repressor / biotin---[acetyl-CoA-carboxylase] ligase
MSEAERSGRLAADQLRAMLGDCQMGNQLIVVEEARSTNDIAWAAADRGAPEGFVVFAERQTAGRGQYGRSWESAPYQGLWFSVLLRLGITLTESPRLTSLLAGVVSATIIKETGCAASIKAPNDIYVAGRKVAGVLVEGRMASDGSYIAVAGLGVNVNQMLEDFPAELHQTAGSLRMATGQQIQRGPLAVALLRKLEIDYRAFTPGG